MSKAEERAYECFPNDDIESKKARFGFLIGYHQAEKDNELTWEDIRDICKMWMESKIPFGVTGEAISIEVLKRFKERKEK